MTVKAGNKKRLATPAIRALSKSLGIRLEDIPVSNNEGRVFKEDVLEFNEQKTASQTSNKLSSQVDFNRSQTQIVAPTQQVKSSLGDKKIAMFETIKMNMYEQGMVKSMNASVTVPTFLLHEEYNVTELGKVRRLLNSKSSVKISIFSMLVKTFSLALKSNPKINSLYFGDQDEYSYQIHSNHNVSFAVDSVNGLVAPNIKNVEEKSMIQIQQEIEQMKDKANKGVLTLPDLTEGTICLSNIGTIGGTYTGPINLPNQTCIVGLGKISTQLKFVGDSQRKEQMYQTGANSSWEMTDFSPQEILFVSFSGDHRVIDGATMTRFSNTWKQIIENPIDLLFSLR